MVAIRSTGPAHVIEDEGVARTQRPTLNFAGAGVAATDAGGKTVITIPGGAAPAATQREWYVDANATAGGTGRSPAGAFTTHAAAIAAASAYDRVYVLSDLTESINVSVQGAHVIGVGRPIINSTGGSLISDRIFKVTNRDVILENFDIRGHPTFKGVALCMDYQSFNFQIYNIRITGGATPTFYPTCPDAGTGVGGIGMLCHSTDIAYAEHVQISDCSIGLVAGTWSTRCTFNQFRLGNNCQDIVSGMNSGHRTGPASSTAFLYSVGIGEDNQVGGNAYLNVTTTTNITGSGNTPVVDLLGDGSSDYAGESGAGNYFQNIDMNEGGAVAFIRVGSCRNTFVGMSTAPATYVKVQGRFNRFDSINIQGQAWQITSLYNTFSRVRGANGFTINAPFNTFENVALDAGAIIQGSGYLCKFRNVFFSTRPVMTGQGNSYENCSWPTGTVLSDLGPNPNISDNGCSFQFTYAASMTPNVYFYSRFTVPIGNSTPFTIENPIDGSNASFNNILHTGPIELIVKNASGGSHGTISVGSNFKLVGGGTTLLAGGAIANGKYRVFKFDFVPADGVYVEAHRSTADIG